MSQSPVGNFDRLGTEAYDESWKALNRLLRTGSSFSGNERNCCFLNLGHGQFANVSSITGFDLMDDGRGLGLVDWDFDGDLDVWTTNRTAPSLRFLKNDVAAEHHFVGFRLQGTRSNRDAIGARLELYAGGDDRETRPQMRTLRAGEGFLSQSSKWIIFGLGATPTIDRFVVRWPSGSVQIFHDLQSDRHYSLIEDDLAPVVWNPPLSPLLDAPPMPKAPIDGNQSRIVLMRRPLLPQVGLATLEGSPIAIPSAGKPILLNLWATWCRPCLEEFEQWSANAELIRDSGIEIVAVCVDEPSEPDQRRETMQPILDRLRFPFQVALPSGPFVNILDAVQRTFAPLQQPMPVPTSFLLDAHGRLAVIYRGPVSVAQLQRDAKSLDASPSEIRKLAVPFSGPWFHEYVPINPRRIAKTLFDDGRPEESIEYLKQLARWYGHRMVNAPHERRPSMKQHFVDVQKFRGALLVEQERYEEALDPLIDYLKLVPDDSQGTVVLAETLVKLNRFEEALAYFDKALDVTPGDSRILSKMADLQLRIGQVEQAVATYRRSLAITSDAEAHYALANALVVQGDAASGIEHFREALRLQPDMLPAANNVAWILATWPETELRNGQEAVRLAETMCHGLDPPPLTLLSTLAASYAEAGRYADAVATLEQVIQRGTPSISSSMLARWQHQLKLYKAGRPFRMSPRAKK